MPVAAQELGRADPVCLRASPRCSVIILTNAGVHALAGGAASSAGFRALADWGVVVRTGSRTYLGATWLVSVDRDGLLTGPMARLVRWITDSTSAEFAIGTSVHRSATDAHANVAGMAKWNLAPAVGLALRPEWRESAELSCAAAPPFGCVPVGSHSFVASVGVEFSGGPGLLLSGIGGAVLGALVAIFAGVSD